ncbi:MAG: hypothetical protein ACXV7I_15375, partial [Ilumatobacteraceae bacterium]
KSATPAPNAVGNVGSVDVKTAEETFADLHDRVIGYLYGSALTLNGIVNQGEVDGGESTTSSSSQPTDDEA